MAALWLSELGEKIRLAREAAGLSQEVLAKRTRLSRVTVNAYENGRVAKPDIKVLARFSIILRADFVIRGCRLCPADMPTASQSSKADQLSLEFGKDYILEPATIKISPHREGIVVEAFSKERPRWELKLKSSSA